MSERMVIFVGSLIVMLVVLVVSFFLINHFTGGKLVKFLVCNALFWVPFGAAASVYCHAIPV